MKKENTVKKKLKANKEKLQNEKHVNYPATTTGYCENERMREARQQRCQDKWNVNRKRVTAKQDKSSSKLVV